MLDESFEHRARNQADSLVLGDFAEVRDANREIGERALMDDSVEVLLVDLGDDFKGMVGDLLYRQGSTDSCRKGCGKTDRSET